MFDNTTLSRVEEVQDMFAHDTMFSKSISLVDFIKVINMSYYNNDPRYYTTIKNKDKLRLKKYVEGFNSSIQNSSFSIKELVDTTNKIIRIRTQMRDVGSYEVTDEVVMVRTRIDKILNPDRKRIEFLYTKALKGNKDYYDSLLFYDYTGIYNNMTALLCLSENELKLQKLTKQYLAKTILFKDNKENLAILDKKYLKDKEDLKNVNHYVPGPWNTKPTHGWAWIFYHPQSAP